MGSGREKNHQQVEEKTEVRTGKPSLPSEMLIISASWNNAEAVDIGDKRIVISTGFINYAGGPASARVLTTISHEFGHLVNHPRFLGSDKWTFLWPGDIYTLGYGCKDKWYYVCDKTYEGPNGGGHPYDSPAELFASTFNIMANFQPQFLAKINSTSGDLNTWLKKVYNAQAQNFHNPDIPQLSAIQNLAGNVALSLP